MKDKKWLQDSITRVMQDLFSTPEPNYFDFEKANKRMRELINQLDEPEVLSQEWIDEHKETIFDLDEDFETEFIKVEDLQNLLVPKQEREQKYYVDLDTAAYIAKWDGDGSVQIYTDSVSGNDEYELHLTEQEIKDYDEKFWPFAVKVEEMEE